MGLNVFENAFVGSMGYITFFNTDEDTVPFQSQPGTSNYSLMLTESGIGLGTFYPEGDLHLTNLDGVGDTVLKLAHPDVGSWNQSVTSTGVMTFNKFGTGGQEFTIRKRNHGVATLDVQGHVRGTSFKSSSSRSLKTGFTRVDSDALLAKVAEMDVLGWRYKLDPDETSHIGPVAEEFQRLFGVGDGSTISSVDAHGVAFGAIQALESRLREQSDLIRAKDAEIDQLKDRVQAIERLVAASPASSGEAPASGE